MIFPGMDPYLEDPVAWLGVHNAMIVYMRDQIQPQIRPRYVASVDVRVFVEGTSRDIYPDVWLRSTSSPKRAQPSGTLLVDEPILLRVPEIEIQESTISILDLRSNQRVVTVIELVSPTNKYAGPGRVSYLDKQFEVRSSQAHLVEIDLLRGGPHVLAVPERVARAQGPYDYLACVNRAEGSRDLFALYPRTIRECLPRIAIPLADGDADVVLDIQEAVRRTYDEGAYTDILNYQAACLPRLAHEDQEWADTLIAKASSTQTES